MPSYRYILAPLPNTPDPDVTAFLNAWGRQGWRFAGWKGITSPELTVCALLEREETILEQSSHPIDQDSGGP